MFRIPNGIEHYYSQDFSQKFSAQENFAMIFPSKILSSMLNTNQK